MILSTTSSLDGYDIEAYLGPVTAHVVIGTGLFTDFFSGWTDLFGMKSQSYQKKLREIERHTMSLLRAQAEALRATAIIGLRVDHDEIAGAGKSMLMVTAMGTAVKARRALEAHPTAKRISSEDLATFMRRQSLLEMAESGRLRWSEETWTFATQHAVAELAPFAIDEAKRQTERLTVYENIRQQPWMHNLEVYLGRISPDSIEALLYRELVQSSASHRVSLLLIERLELFRPERVRRLLEANSDRQKHVWALQAARATKSHWGASDVHAIAELIDAIPKVFAQPIESLDTKGLFGGSKKRWVCICGHEVPSSDPRCACTRDRNGVRSEEIGPDAAIQLLQRRAAALSFLLDVSDVGHELSASV